MVTEEKISLDPQQKKAVRYNQGPLLIVAGAGTGKTLVLVEKIKYLLKKKLALPEEILALTFTDKAASEMEERIDQALPYGYFQIFVSTFHSFADSVLKENIASIGLSPDFRLMTEAETIIFLKKNLFLFDLNYFRPLGNPNKFLLALIQHFSRASDEDISPTQYIKWAQIQDSKTKIQDNDDKIDVKKYLELARAYKKYQDLKIRENLMDFSDLVYYLLQLFRQRLDVLKKYQKQFKYILVDEFQDTNIAQYQLIKLLCHPKNCPKLTVVGDDSQSIYKFRGASVSNILNFIQDYKKAKQITLQKNFRSNQTILDTSYRLIKHNDPDTLECKLGISKKLIAQKKDNRRAIEFYLNDRVEEEAEFVTKKIKELKIQKRFSDFAILVRANSHSEPFIRSLSQSGIPYQFLGPGQLFKQPEIKDLIAYLKVLYNLEDSVSFYRVLSMDIFSLDKKDIHFLMAFAKKTNQSLFQAIIVFLSFYYPQWHLTDYDIYKKFLPIISSKTREKLGSICQMIKNHLNKIKINTAGQILYFFLEETAYLAKLTQFKTEKEEKIALNVSKFFNKLKSYEVTHQDASIFAVVEFIEMSMELGESPLVSQTDIARSNAVNILSVHSAKGLEFKIVFLVNLSAGRFPTYERKETIPLPDKLIKEILPQGNYHQQEERRLFYVGLTRAADNVFLSASNFYGEERRKKRVSPFVIESLGSKQINQIFSSKQAEKAQLSIFNFKPKEEKIIKQPYRQNQFSYTQLESFKTCPLQYKYQYIIKIPTSPNAVTAFGSSIHQTLEIFYQAYLKDKTIGLGKMLDFFKNNWIPIGYSSKAQEKRMSAEGQRQLTDYFRKYHHQQLKIVSLEKLFKIKIGDDLYLTGKIDRVDAPEKNKIEIIDYKTGKQPSDKELKISLQLSIYALAACQPKLFNKKLDDIKLSFYYLQNGNKFSLKKTPEDIKKVQKEIFLLVEQIQNSDFLPKVGPWCSFCPFRMICEAWQ